MSAETNFLSLVPNGFWRRMHSTHAISSSNLSSHPPYRPFLYSLKLSSVHHILTVTPAVSISSEQSSTETHVKITAVVDENSISPMKAAAWKQVMLHTAKRMKWVDETFEMVVLSTSTDGNPQHLQDTLDSTDVLLVVGVTDPKLADLIQKHTKKVANVICFESCLSLENKLGGVVVKDENRESKEVMKTVTEAWGRYNSDDIRFCLLVVINAFIKPVPTLNNLRSKGLGTLTCMVNNCASQIVNCLLDPSCRKALQCLNKCSPVDQVCNYRCLASYESPTLEAFSLCVLQKHNCLGLHATIPTQPYVPPLSTFRGMQMSAEIAEDIFVGWLGRLDWSWRVVAGQNPAYDQFPCQYQLFYGGKARGSFWYEPVFKVKTLEGDLVWRRRKYRVKRGRVPGTFNFSVLDNGVVSNEFWTIVDVAEDFSWGLFHYSGAARVAGQSYTGAVLVSPDGTYPREEEYPRLRSALGRCEIEEWELFNVDNCSCDDPPLGLPAGSKLHSLININ